MPLQQCQWARRRSLLTLKLILLLPSHLPVTVCDEAVGIGLSSVTQLFLASPLLTFLPYESVHNIPPYKILTPSSNYDTFFKKKRWINRACKWQSSKQPAEHPHPVNEALQEPLGRVNPCSHLLFVLGGDSKERCFTRMAAGGSSNS